MNTIGKKTSFFEIFNDGNQKIEIPIIQRDYAQGRESAKEIRINFLKSIKKSLENNEFIHLDFIYGSIENNVFVPLDGQQRLTTLFLLHWYIAVREDRLVDFRDTFTNKKGSKFTYETRVSSRLFCNALVSNNIVLPDSDDESLSEIIKDSSWYSLSWDNDPTISSMLNMLDSIHQFYYNSKEFYNRLIDLRKFVSFQYIELNEFGLTDNLYIKMNARGKSLTDFENFKAKYSKILEQQDKKSGTKLKDEFTLKIDTSWTDLFWPYRNTESNIFDDQIMNIIRIVITNYFVLRPQSDYYHIASLISSKTKFTYYHYSEFDCFVEDVNRNIISYLNCMLGNDNQFRLYLKDKGIIDELYLFKSAISYNMSYPERIQFYAFYHYLISGYSADKLFDWMRVVRNLTVNTRIDEIQDYIDALKSISALIKHSETILEYLTVKKIEISNYASIQVAEERIKASLLLNDETWRNRIIEMENHEYFNGQIDFLLDFSGINDYYNEHANLEWSADENAKYLKQFEVNSQKAKAIFNANGIRDFEDYIFERALLSIGDYLLDKGYNYSFGINGRERDISWKRLLRDNNESRGYLRELFDAIKPESVKADLKRIINKAKINDWRKHFVEFPELISVCGKSRFIRYNGDEEILLLEKTQTNGLHREYYTYALKVKLEKMGNNVSYQPDYSIDYDKYIYHINKHKIKVFFDKRKVVKDGYEYCYRVDFKKNQYFLSTDKEVLAFLSKQGIIKLHK
jgi:hypothetical protein